MRRDLITSALAIVVFTRRVRPRLPAGRDGRRPGRRSRTGPTAAVKRDGKVVGSRLIGQDFRKPVLDANGKPEGGRRRQPGPGGRPALLPGATVDSHGLHADATGFTNLGPNQQGRCATCSRANIDAYLAAGAALHAGLTAREHAGRRGHQLGIRRRPAHLRGQRRDPGAPHRRGPPAPARARARS